MAVMGSQLVAVLLESFIMIPVNCKVIVIWLSNKISWLIGCCCVALTGSQMVAMVFLRGFIIDPSWLQGCNKSVAKETQVVARVLLGGYYEVPGGC